MKKVTNFAIGLDESTMSQFDSCCSEDFVVHASLMPDAHKGYVAPIGSVFKTRNKIIPSWVGYDIGCGVIACVFRKENIVSLVREKAKRIFDDVSLVIPMGKGRIGHLKDVSDKSREDFKVILEDFCKRDYDKDVYKFLRTQAVSHLGSLGSGNHFIELGFIKGKCDEVWLVIHSGSRGIGHKVATHYMKKASGSDKGYEKTYSLDIDSQEGREYLNVLNFGLEFALLNRLEMAYKARDVLRNILRDSSLNFELWTNKNHNHAIFERGFYIHRKGATPARKNEKGVIPANMQEGCFLVEGLGNKDFLESSSHGAGRVLSRTEAKLKIKMKEFEDKMKGIVGKIDKNTLDEAPQAYKNIYDVMDAQKKSVRVLSHIKPIINWKG